MDSDERGAISEGGCFETKLLFSSSGWHSMPTTYESLVQAHDVQKLEPSK